MTCENRCLLKCVKYILDRYDGETAAGAAPGAVLLLDIYKDLPLEEACEESVALWKFMD